MSEELVKKPVSGFGGKIDEMGRLPDGSGFATASFPLPKDHWLTANPDDPNIPPMVLRCGVDQKLHGLSRRQWDEMLIKAAKYAIRASTANGKIDDFDPDAMARNFLNGCLGYYTSDGFSKDEVKPEPSLWSPDWLQDAE